MSDEKMVERIAKLLAKAEGTDNEAEANTFMAAAQRLMTKHAIAESMIRAAGRRQANEIITKVIEVRRTWWRTDLNLVGVIAIANDCQYYGTAPLRRGPGWITVVGYPEDISNVEMVFASLQIQLVRALRGSPSDQSWRRSFRYGFSQRVGERLAESRAHVVHEEAKKDPSLLPVLMDKAAQVKNALPNDLKVSFGRVGQAGGYSEGTVAGNRADVGGPAVPSGLRALNA